MSADARRFSPAAARNRGPILEVLARVLPAQARVLEIASGSGEHAVHFAAALPGLDWQPTDVDASALASVEAWRVHAATSNVRAPIQFDVHSTSWPVDNVDAIYCANMIHIAPPSATTALLDGAARHLAAGGLLVLYGPYRLGDGHTAASNAAFDEDLRARDPLWGVRDLYDVLAQAAARGLAHRETVAMPANNFVVVLAQRSSQSRSSR